MGARACEAFSLKCRHCRRRRLTLSRMRVGLSATTLIMSAVLRSSIVYVRTRARVYYTTTLENCKRITMGASGSGGGGGGVFLGVRWSVSGDIYFSFFCFCVIIFGLSTSVCFILLAHFAVVLPTVVSPLSSV